jgi:hypothetical protein
MLKKRYLTYCLYGLFLLCAQPMRAQCGDVQVLTPLQQSQLQNLVPLIDTALFYEQLHQIDSLSQIAKTIYATEAGQPENNDTYTTLSAQTNWLTLQPALQLSRLLIAADSQAYVDVWQLCKGRYPPAYLPHSVPLRAGAEVCAGLLKIAAAETDTNRRNAYQQWAIRGLDSLLTMQLNSGAWPFPDLRTYNDPVFTSIINNYLQAIGADSVNVLVNGWIIDDSGRGDFKFDAGVIAGAYAEAYSYTGDTAYLGAARRTANYLLPLHYNRNYNYNTFAAYGMAKAYSQSQTDMAFYNRAVQNLREAVLPGQIPSGNWMDGHNAESVYHAVMLYNMAPVLAQMPQTDPLHDTLATMLTLATRRFIQYEGTCGASVGYKSLLRLWVLDTHCIAQPLHDSITNLIGRYINQSNSNGRFLDVPAMGLYLELLQLPNAIDANIERELSAAVFPNPATDVVSVYWDMPVSATLRLYNMQGELVLEKIVSETMQETKISLENIAAGVYLLEWTTEAGAKGYSKLIKN